MLTRRSALALALGVVVIVTTSALFLSAETALSSSHIFRRAFQPSGSSQKTLEVPRDPAAPLRFRSDGSFQITVFGDLHFGENAWKQWGPEQDRNTVRVIETVLDAERPDLVVLNGDLITGENAFRENSTVYLDQMVTPMIRRAIPWASTYGNHDSDFNLSRADLLAREQQQKPKGLSRTANMIPAPIHGGDEHHAGMTNYYLPVYGSDCMPTTDDDMADRCVPRLILWFFDSRGGFHYQQQDSSTGKRVGQENWVHGRVVSWFEKTQSELQVKYATVISSLAFVHIPPNVAYALQMNRAPGHGGKRKDKGSPHNNIDSHRQPGINDDKPLAQQAEGWCPSGLQGGCAYGGQDEPFMRAMAAAGNGTGVIAMFVGHDHGNTWCHTWASGQTLPGVDIPGTGLHICFGQHSGYGGYGSWTRGGRQVRVTEDALKQAAKDISSADRRPSIDTWIRLETADVVGNVSLNATYGHDVYPATPSTHTHCPTCNSVNDHGSLSSSRKEGSQMGRLWESVAKSSTGG